MLSTLLLLLLLQAKKKKKRPKRNEAADRGRTRFSKILADELGRGRLQIATIPYRRRLEDFQSMPKK